jgi:hypothetical protein
MHVFVAAEGDNTAPLSVDLTYLITRDVTATLSPYDGWEWYKDDPGDDEPLPVLPSVEGEWDSGQCFLSSIHDLGELESPRFIGFYSANSGAARYSVGVATSDDLLTWTRPTSPIITLGAPNNFVHSKHIKVGSNWYLVVRNAGYGTDTLSGRAELWTSSVADASSGWTRIKTDIFDGSTIDVSTVGGIGIISDMWEDDGKIKFYVTLGYSDFYGTTAPLQDKVGQKIYIAYTDDLFDSPVKFEQLVYETSQISGYAFHVFCGPMTLDGYDCIMADEYAYDVQTSLGGQQEPSIRGKLIIDGSVIEGSDVGLNVFPTNVHRFYKMVQPQIDTDISTAEEIITGTSGTTSGSIVWSNELDSVLSAGGYLAFSDTVIPSTTLFGVRGRMKKSTWSTSFDVYSCESFKISFDSSRHLIVRVNGSSGYTEVKSTDAYPVFLGTSTLDVYFDFGFTFNAGTIKLFFNYSLDIATTVLHDDSVTEVVSSTELKVGVDNGNYCPLPISSLIIFNDDDLDAILDCELS